MSTNTVNGEGPVAVIAHTVAAEHPGEEREEEREEEESREKSIDRQLLLNSWPHRAGHVIEELLLTEKTYLESLEDIINVK